MRGIIVITLAILTGCAGGSGRGNDPAAAARDWTPRVRAWAFAEKPGLNPETHFVIEEPAIAGLGAALGVAVLLVGYQVGDESPFSHAILAADEEKLTPFGTTFGGHGLMSAVVVGEALYYTYSWGSGIHRSHVGVMTRDATGLRFVESGGFVDADLFVRAVDGAVRVETGTFEAFGEWSGAKGLGTVTRSEDALVIVDADGNDVAPQFSRSP